MVLIFWPILRLAVLIKLVLIKKKRVTDVNSQSIHGDWMHFVHTICRPLDVYPAHGLTWPCSLNESEEDKRGASFNWHPFVMILLSRVSLRAGRNSFLKYQRWFSWPSVSSSFNRHTERHTNRDSLSSHILTLMESVNRRQTHTDWITVGEKGFPLQQMTCWFTWCDDELVHGEEVEETLHTGMSFFAHFLFRFMRFP